MFNFNELNLLESYEEKVDYAMQNLELVGSGQTRVVFALDDSKVIKIASKEKGMIANNVEKHFSDKGWDRLAKVLQHDEDFMWVVSERAAPIDEDTFRKLAGVDSKEFHFYLYLHGVSKIMPYASVEPAVTEETTLMKKRVEDSRKNPLSNEIINKSDELNFNLFDISLLENLGIIKKDGEEFIVIIDYGSFDKKFRKFPSVDNGSTFPQLSSL